MLRALVESLTRKNKQLVAAVTELQDNNKVLAARVRELEQLTIELKQMVFGKKRERFDGHPQLPFAGDEPEPQPEPHVLEASDDEEVVQHPRPARTSRGVRRLPKDLPREIIEIELPAEQRRCAHGCLMEAIGFEVTEEVDFRPASFLVREVRRPKYACKAHEESGIVTAELPERPIAKGMAGAGLLAHVVTAKYKDHLPLHRQHGIFLREGVDIAESTMVDWVADVAKLCEPVVAAMRDEVLTAHVVQTDDTPICVQDRAVPKGSKRGYLWVYLGDGTAVFDYTPGRSRAGPRDFLGDRQGWVQADAYSGYDVVFRESQACEVGCWAHARRYFFKALETEPGAAGIVLSIIRRLYEIEHEATSAGASAEERVAWRKRESDALLAKLHRWLVLTKEDVLPKSPIGRAISYSLNQWTALTRFLEDGRLQLDNNAAERALRQVAVGRKNWIFAGSDAGARRAAVLYSLVGSCSNLGINCFEYLRDVLVQLAADANRAAALTPRAWLAARASA